MKIVFYILGGLGLIFLIKLALDWRKARFIAGYGQMAMGEINKERHFEKENRKIRIMQYLEAREAITNNQVEKLLEVSDASVTRYLDELEAEGKIVQESRGSKTYYRKI